MPILLLLMALQGDPVAARAEDLAAYRAEVAKSGRDAASQMALARWCEAHGLRAEREEHLARAVMLDPTHREARKAGGLAPASRAEYAARRDRAPETADGRWELAVWCESRGLVEEAKLHFTQVVLLDPKRDSAWRRLGYKKRDGRWLSDEQVAESKREVEAQHKADRSWKALLETWKGQLARADRPRTRDKDAQAARAAEAERLLAAVHDPRAVPSIVRVFGGGDAADQARAVQLLAQIASPPSTRALAVLSFQGKSADVRRLASESLRDRDPAHYVELLAALLRDEVRYEFRPDGGTGAGATLSVEDSRAVRVRRYGSAAPMDLNGLLANVAQPGPEIGFVLDSRTTARPLPSDAHLVGTMPDGTPAYIVDDTGVTIRVARVGSAFNVNPIPTAFGGTPGPGSVTQIRTKRAEPGAAPPNAGATPATTAPAANPAVLDGLPRPLAAAAASLVPSFDQFEATQMAMLQQELQHRWMIEESQRMALAVQQQQRGDVEAIERANARTRESNGRIVLALTTATGQDLGADREAWSRWWTERRGSRPLAAARGPKPTFYEDVPIPYRPGSGPPTATRAEPPRLPFCILFEHHLSADKTPSHGGGATAAYSNTGGEIWISTPNSCFAPGTAVATPSGPRPIESLRDGDAVYVPGPGGRTSVAPVLATHRIDDGPTVRLAFVGGEVVASPTHPFARAGGGWARADALAEGDLVPSRAGASAILGVAAGGRSALHNLEVSGGNAYFVGEAGALVHDGTPIGPSEVE